jgi:hypothetical protein
MIRDSSRVGNQADMYMYVNFLREGNRPQGMGNLNALNKLAQYTIYMPIIPENHNFLYRL